MVQNIKKLKVIAVFVAYRAEKTILDFYNSFPRELFDEIILVDDCSPDRTFELAKTLPIKSYRNEINLGYGGNMKRCIDLALLEGADVVVDIHPDGEYLPSAIKPALIEIERGADFVLGNRFGTEKGLLERGMYFYKIIPIKFLNWIDQFVLGLNLHDFHQGFRVYTKKLLNTVNYKENANDYLFSFELIAQAAFHKLRVTEVPVETKYEGKKRGASFKNSIKYSLGTFKILAKYILAKIGVPIKMFN
jgi:glycosyltransferase involved in cell wall biosynthesis